MASDEETEESDTQIDTDSEFADDHVEPGPPKPIPTIVINESQDPRQDGSLSPVLGTQQSQTKKDSEMNHPGEPRKDFVAQKVDLGAKDKGDNDEEWTKDGGEKSASLTNLNVTGKVNPRAEQLKRLLQRTESTEAIAAKRALQLKRQYLLGEQTNLPRKSVSTADLGNRFKSFMDKISETQKMLNPAPQPSAAMQAFMSTSVTSPKSPTSSPSSPQLTARSISLPQGDVSSSSTNGKDTSSSGTYVYQKDDSQDITTHIESSVFPVEAINEVSIEKVSPLEQLKGFPLMVDDAKEAIPVVKDASQGKFSLSESSSSESSSTSTSESDYDNVPSGHKHSVVKKSATAVKVTDDKIFGFDDKSNDKEKVTTNIGNVIPAIENAEVSHGLQNKESSSEVGHQEVCQKVIKCDKEQLRFSDTNEKGCAQVNSDLEREIGLINDDDFGMSAPEESDSVETINRELVKINAPRSLEYASDECPSNISKPQEAEKSRILELHKLSDSNDDVDELFDKLASEAVNDEAKFAELVNSPKTVVSSSDKGTLIGGEINSSNIRDIKQKEKSLDLDLSDKSNLDTEANVHIIVEKSNENLSSEPLHTDNTVLSRTNLVDYENLENRRLCKKESLSSPEGKENTEFELSDWAADNDGLSAGEDLEGEVNERDRLNVKKRHGNAIARIASEESLGDTDSAISTGPSKATSVPSKPSVLADLEGIEYMDTSESASSPDEAPLKQQGYRKLEEDTPTTPIAPQMSLLGFGKVDDVEEVARESKSSSSESTSTEMDEDTSHSSVQECVNNNTEQQVKKDPEDKKACRDSKSMSEPPSLCESKPKLNGEQRRDSLDDFISPKRYEGYIPRFKERMSPFGYVRDSLDVRKNSTKSPLFTPTRQDVEEREKNEKRLAKLTLPSECTESKTIVVSPNTAKKQIERSLKNKDREKEKDLIKEMVMSRISRKTPDKTGRRGSRTSNSPLSSTSSRTSLFSPQSSQENLLDKSEDTCESQEKEDMKQEDSKQTISADSKMLLRLDSVQPNLPESGQTFDAEENRSKIKVGSIFRGDSVLGGSASYDNIMTKSLDSSLKSHLPSSGETFEAEKGRSKVKLGSAFREDSVLGYLGKSESLQDTSVPFADDSQDEEVFEQNDSSKRIHLGISSKNYIGRKNSDSKAATKLGSNEPASPLHSNLPATPMTHPEQFHKTSPKREVFQTPLDTVPVTPLRRNRPSGSKGMCTPANVERPLSTPNLSTIDRERAREEARHRARLKTDLDLGLSPPNLADNLREKLRKGSVSESEGDISRDVLSKEVAACIKQGDTTPLQREDSRSKNKEERVKELLAEQREHRQRDPSHHQEEWGSKDDRVRERLEEYRQKRKVSSKSAENGETRPNSQLLRRPTHRPSLLELESLQVFTSPPTKATSSVPSSSPAPQNTTASSPSISVSAPQLQDKQASSISQPSPSTCPSASASTTPGSQQSQEPSSTEKVVEKKSGKKSKDRERRRSLIQVFAGRYFIL